MARPDKKKIPTNESAVGSGLFQAFSSLSAEGLPPGAADAPEAPPSAPESKVKRGRVVLRKETAHRGGKTVIIVGGFDDSHRAGDLAQLAKTLRASCGCGGAVKGREIELQGDLAGRIRTSLEQLGYAVAGVK